jgi:GT2 family glycosyltransferase
VATPFPHLTIDISISIVSYNTRDLLRACLQSLEARHVEVELEIIVVDNGSTDGSAEMVRAEFPKVLLIDAGENPGYGRANNLGLKHANGRHFFVLNSDTEVQPGALRALVDFLDDHPQAGAVTAQLILPDGSIQPSCATDPNLMKVFWEQTYLDRLFPNNKITGGYTMTHWNYDDVREVEQVAGAAVVIRREAWQQIGGFDPAFFMYFEDTDLCIRLRKAGWSIWFLPDARVHHKVGASSDKDWQLRARMISSLNWSRYYYFSKRESTFRGRILKVLVIMGALLRLSAWSVIALIKPTKRDQVKLFQQVLRQSWKMRVE